ncbi:hypothetical protein Bca4012_014287 [Brassica carinata]
MSGSMSFSSQMSKEDEEMSRTALSAFRAKEEDIEKKKMEITERFQAQLGLGRVEEETKHLALIREEEDDSVNKELKPLGHTVQKKGVSIISSCRHITQFILRGFLIFLFNFLPLFLLNIQANVAFLKRTIPHTHTTRTSGHKERHRNTFSIAKKSWESQARLLLGACLYCEPSGT